MASERKHIRRQNPDTGEWEEFDETYHLNQEQKFDDEGNPIEEDKSEEDEYTSRTPEEQAEWEAQEESDDEATAETQEARAYEERKARETERKRRRIEHAAAAERVKRGSLKQEHLPAQSKRLLNWVVDLKKERRAQELSWLDPEGPPATQRDVEETRKRLEKTQKAREDLIKDRSTEQFRLKRMEAEAKKRGPSANLPDPQDPAHLSLQDRINQSRRRIDHLNAGQKNLTDQIEGDPANNRYGLVHQLDEVSAAAARSSGRVGNQGSVPPRGPALHGEEEHKALSKTRGYPPGAARLGENIPEYRYVDGQKVPIHTPESEARKADVIRFNELREKMVGTDPKSNSLTRAPRSQRRKLTKAEEREFNELQLKIKSYRNIAIPNESGDLEEAATRRNAKENLEQQYPVELVPEPETIEHTLARHGQENPKAGVIEGWKSTTTFNKEQAQRKYGGLLSGEMALGYGKNKTGEWERQPTEKAKFTLGPNQDWIIKSNEWKPLNEQEANKGQDSFSFTVKSTGKQRVWEPTGKVYDTGLTVGDTVRELGLGLHVESSGNNKFRVTTDRGEHLNPDQIDALKEALHVYHGMDPKVFHEKGTVEYERLHKRVPVGYSKLPKGLSAQEAIQERKTLYKGRIGSSLGQRDIDTNELKEGERNSIGLRVGNRAIQRHFNEDTDSTGWGLSWRPGEKEKSDFLLAIPRARQNREMAKAFDEANTTGNEQPIYDYIKKYYPDSDEAEVEQHKSKVKQEGAALVSAGVLASYYSTKRNVPRRIGNTAWRGAQSVPGIGPKAYNTAERHGFTKERGNLWNDVDWAYRRPMTRRLDRAIFRVQHPLTTGTINPDTGLIDPDPTVPGLMFHNEFRPNLHSIRYRKRINMPPGKRLGREFERKVMALRGEVHTTQLADKVLREERKVARPERWLRLQQARTLMHDPSKRGQSLQERLESLRTEINTKLEPVMENGKKIYPEFELYGKKHNTTIEKEHELRSMLTNQRDELDKLISHAKKNNAFTREGMGSTIKSYVERHPNNVPKYIWRTGLYGGGAAAAVGLGVLTVDRYQTYKHKKGEEVHHPILESLPETISLPKVRVRKTRELTIPDNTFTRALDFENQKVPVGGRISLVREQKLRLHNFTDVSGEKFQRGLPMLGGVNVSAPAPVQGSMKEAILPKSPGSEVGPTKNMYVKGRRIPVDISVGKKERWDNKTHKLRAKYNRYKPDQDDMEKLAVMSTDNEGRLTSQGEGISNLYYNNERFQDILTDKKELARLHGKHSGWKSKSKDKGLEDNFALGQGQRLEDQQAAKRISRRRIKDYRESQKDRG